MSNFRAKAAEAESKKGQMPIGPRARVSSEHLNKYIKQFPQSGRDKVQYFDPKWQSNEGKNSK